MQPSLSSTAARIEITPPRLLTPSAVFAISAYGLLLMIPAGIVMLAVTVLQFGILTFLIPLLIIAVATFFLPFGFGNPHVAKLVRSLNPDGSRNQDGFAVQLTLTPRIRSGLRAMIEDADDIGWLSFTESELVFHGDSIKLSVPYDRIRELQPQNIGWRGLFVYGPKTAFTVSGLPHLDSLQFAERSSWLLPTSRRTARKIHDQLAQRIAPARSPFQASGNSLKA